MPYLIHYHNGTAISHIELTEQVSIGRDETNDIHVADATMSARHAVVERSDSGGFQIRDLGSTNGVLVKGRKVQQSPLSDGDIVMVGTHEWQFAETIPEPLQQTARIRKSWIPGVYYTSDE